MKKVLVIPSVLRVIGAALFLTSFAWGAEPASPKPFVSGDRWSVVGDSITHNGTYYSVVYLYYATRFPGIDLAVSNYGISGDSAGGALKRYDWDIRRTKPTVATVMFGMNDVNRSLYGAEVVPPELQAKRDSALETYRQNMTQLVSQLSRDGARIIIITPSLFDDTADLKSPPQKGVNAALAKCAKMGRDLAVATGATLIDFHAPMSALNLQLQKADPTFTLTGPDRTHPKAPGHLVLAYYFLKAQGLPAVVSETVIDATALKVTKKENVEIAELRRNNGAVTFTSLEKALPFPIAEEAKPALAYVPFQQELNREWLQVTGLKPGTYRLTIDGQEIRRGTAEEWAAGVDLAAETATPQYRQAESVAALIGKWRALVAGRIRRFAQVEHGTLQSLERPIDFEKAKVLLNQKLEEIAKTNPPQGAYMKGVYESYLQFKPNEKNIAAEIETYPAQIRAAAIPQKHHYALEEVK